MVVNATAEKEILGSFPGSDKGLLSFSIRHFSEAVTESGFEQWAIVSLTGSETIAHCSNTWDLNKHNRRNVVNYKLRLSLTPGDYRRRRVGLGVATISGHRRRRLADGEQRVALRSIRTKSVLVSRSI